MNTTRQPNGLIPEHGDQPTGVTDRFVRWCAARSFSQVVPPALLGGAAPAAFSVPAAAPEHILTLAVVALVVCDLPIAVWLVCRVLTHKSR